MFSPAYARLYANDSHAPGSVDRVLLEAMTLLCAATAPLLYAPQAPTTGHYRPGERPELERIVEDFADPSPEGIVGAVARYCAGLSEHGPAGLDALRLGGTEEEIIARGSDWCTDVARVACALCQVAGVPARLVYLADTAHAYSGHAIIEAQHAGQWGALDPTTNVVYRCPDGTPASTWRLQHDPALLVAHQRGEATPCSTPTQFRAAAIAEYSIADRDRYDFTTSRLNAYYRAILEQASRGWPGGLRWLHGEDVYLNRGDH
ncbi:MAG: transglutaminase domain-containing protein [Chloroflexi bacterium]|nr:transglutaminase domain-containing protein [Chloroflexota bacterium]